MKRKFKYTIIFQVDASKEIEQLHDRVTLAIVNYMNQQGCEFLVGANNEVVTVTDLNGLM